MKVEAHDTVDGRPAWVLSVVDPADPRETAAVWTDEQTCVPVRVEFLEGGKPVKRYRAKAAALRHEGRYWFASEAEMTDVATGSRSVLRFEGVDAGARLTSVDFNPQQFYQRN
jgi:hypothetical protein